MDDAEGRRAPEEAALYELLCDPATTGALRIEQERIPLEEARAEMLRRMQ
jgi:hypothetical protein